MKFVDGLCIALLTHCFIITKNVHFSSLQVKQLHDWLAHWHEQFLAIGSKKKGKKANDSGVKKAVLLCGTPGIGKTTSAKLVCQMLHFQTIEVMHTWPKYIDL